MVRIALLLLLALPAAGQSLLINRFFNQTADAVGGCTVTTNAITITSAGTHFGNTSNANSYFYPAFTPSAAGNTILVGCAFSPVVASANITNTGTTQLSWSFVGITQTNSYGSTTFNTIASPAHTLAVWISQLPPGVTPFSMEIVLTTTSGTGANMTVLDITGASTNLLWGQDAIHQVALNRSNAVANPRIDWAAPGNSGSNAIVMFIADDVNSAADATAGTGFTEIGETAYNTPAAGLFTQYQLAVPASTTFGTNTTTARDWAGIAVELKAGTNACGYADPLAIPAGAAHFYVDTASNAGGTGYNSNDVTTANRAFASLREAVTHANLDTNNYRVIWCKGVTNDVLNVTQTHWDSLSTAPTTKLFIIGDNITGTNNPNTYKIAITNSDALYNNAPGHGQVRNVWVMGRSTTSTGADYSMFRFSTANVGSGLTDCDWKVINCGAAMTATGTDDITGFDDSDFAVNDQRNRMQRINCTAYGGTYGFRSAAAGPWLVENYNCTSVSNEFNYIDPQLVVNCIGAWPTVGNSFESVGEGNGFRGWNSTTDTSSVGKNSRQSQTFTFIGGFDFHLQSGDTGAKNVALGDPLSGLFRFDIDGQTRSPGATGVWDIGSDEQQ